MSDCYASPTAPRATLHACLPTDGGRRPSKAESPHVTAGSSVGGTSIPRRDRSLGDNTRSGHKENREQKEKNCVRCLT